MIWGERSCRAHWHRAEHRVQSSHDKCRMSHHDSGVFVWYLYHLIAAATRDVRSSCTTQDWWLPNCERAALLSCLKCVPEILWNFTNTLNCDKCTIYGVTHRLCCDAQTWPSHWWWRNPSLFRTPLSRIFDKPNKFRPSHTLKDIFIRLKFLLPWQLGHFPVWYQLRPRGNEVQKNIKAQINDLMFFIIWHDTARIWTCFEEA